MFKVTHRHDFISQKKCAHTRLLVREHGMNMSGSQHTAWKHGGRDKT